MKTFPLRSRSRKRGYTLTEVLIALGISVALGGAATWFMMEGARASLKATNNSVNDLAQWSIFVAISVDSKTANGMSVYSTFTPADMADSTKRLNKDGRGNVLILTKSSQDAGSSRAAYDKITGYIYSPTTKNLRKFEYTVTAAEKGDLATNVLPATLEEILVNNYTTLVPHIIGENLTPPVTGFGVFLVRERGHSGILSIEAAQGIDARTVNKKLIEASFFIRG
ncbi:hypothetical protein CMV30_01435 [Nibricoccus aquaticus]|uniref:Prepilin-type cleavage/methylation domain-containing protein n=1 Tax=Nibricoccus aquaticus TaxID=2576891 RepID=A0A290Q2J5_9BACT|nr:type II secretion system protein [Nibricoccus aquaticus]ATC62734.1 hypothetical protein CMV30_01435 [Nibricoccus aquaticus]